MNKEESLPKKMWAKLVAIQPDSTNIVLYPDKNEDLFDGKLRVFLNQDGESVIENLSASCLSIDGSFLETSQEKKLLGGERLSFKLQDNDESASYIFCKEILQQSNVKRDRDEVIESENLKKLIKIESDLQKELTCSICRNLLQKSMSLAPCQHTFCSSCLFNHFKSSIKCPLCRVEAVFVAKSPVLSNLIQLIVENYPTLQSSQEEEKELEQINFGGRIVQNEEGVYIGSRVKNKKHGQGKMIYNDGRIYEGNWRRGKREGRGVQVYPTGGKYDGYWKNDEKHGTGKFVWANGQEYEGDYQDNIRHGSGTMKYKDGVIYQGYWENGDREGKGTLTLSKGTKYEGEWVDDELQPEVTIKYSNGKKYEGEIDVDSLKRHGKGTLILTNYDKCQGVWVNDVPQSPVTIKYANGEKYVGEVQAKDFKKHGKGVFTFKNGDKFDGEWINDKQNGCGKEIFRDGKRIFEGVWKEGRISGKVIMTDEDGAQYQMDLKKN